MSTAQTKVKSPNYPSFSLEEAIENVAKVHSKDRRNPVNREVVAAHMGYSGLSGASDKAISNLMQYGLLERVGKGEIRVSQLAVDILHPDTDAQYKSALRQSAFLPPLFQLLKSRFGEDHFSDAALRSYLVKQDFNDRAMNPIIRSYSETCSFLKLKHAGENDGAEAEMEVESIEPRNDVMLSPVRDMPYTSYQAAPSSSSVGVPLMVGEQVLYSEVAGPSNYLKLIASGDLNEDLIEGIESYLSRLKRRIRNAAQQAERQPTKERALNLDDPVDDGEKYI